MQKDGAHVRNQYKSHIMYNHSVTGPAHLSLQQLHAEQGLSLCAKVLSFSVVVFLAVIWCVLILKFSISNSQITAVEDNSWRPKLWGKSFR